MTMEPVWQVAPHPQSTPREHPGSFRQHDIHPFPGGMTPPSWPLVAAAVDSWVGRVNLLAPRVPLFPEQLADLHAEFERIHPFLDGNGRTGRLVLNLVLVRLGYPPAIIYKRQRSTYLMALRRADAGDCGALAELLARSILHNLFLFIVPAVAGPARLVPLAALATDEIASPALRTAAIAVGCRLPAEPTARSGAVRATGSTSIWRRATDESANRRHLSTWAAIVPPDGTFHAHVAELRETGDGRHVVGGLPSAHGTTER